MDEDLQYLLLQMMAHVNVLIIFLNYSLRLKIGIQRLDIHYQYLLVHLSGKYLQIPVLGYNKKATKYCNLLLFPENNLLTYNKI